METWFGPIAVCEIVNKGAAEDSVNAGSVFFPLKSDSVKFVHYPDCQQLIIWLPNAGRGYDKIQLVMEETGILEKEWPVSDKLSGSIQLLWDTLDIKPGTYIIRIIKDKDHLHEVAIKKYNEGEKLPASAEELPQPVSAEPVIYRDGNGKIIEDEDLLLREKVIKEIADRFSRHIEYQGAGRGGYVVYVEGDLRISFYYEFGAGKCIAYIEIPSGDKWEQETSTPLSRREEIISFTAQQVQAREAPRSLLKITGSSIEFWER